jgi:hypothetical protein
MKLLKLSFISGLLLLLCTCKKYEDDSIWPHFRSPEKRLTLRPWNSFSYYWLLPSHSAPDCPIDDEKITFLKDNTCTGGCLQGINGTTNLFFSTNFNFDGTWELIENDEKLKITYPNFSKSTVYKILQLDSHTLKMKNDSVLLILSHIGKK